MKELPPFVSMMYDEGGNIPAMMTADLARGGLARLI